MKPHFPAPPAFYPRNAAPELDSALFRNPTSEYRGAPFWAWNNRLNREQLFRQIEALKSMGLGGFHMHPRTGLDTPYVGDEFLEMVRDCVQKAKSEGMRAYLYDEDRWPSGFAGGLVTVDPRFRARHLLWTCKPYDQNGAANVEVIASAHSGRTGNGTLLARYEIVLENGFLASYRRLEAGETIERGREWLAYLETAQPNSWFNNQTYVDTLNPAAMRRFIETTHEKYARVVGEEFGRTIPAIFTDEPQFVHKQGFQNAEDTGDLVIPFTADLLESYAQTYGQHLEDYLPELFWQLPGNAPSVARYRYHDHVCERFTRAFADQIGSWCASRGLALTGHMMEEPTLQSQTAALGEAMRSYRAFQIPGIDILADSREYNTAKQAQSAARQFGCAGVTSELYGICNWDFPFWGHKAQGDWQAALGVTLRVPHLTWVSMGGEAKRDYPASIGPHSPWFEEYPLVENHFARLNTVLTRGKALVRVGVVHPIESFWLEFGPRHQTQTQRTKRETRFAALTDWLLFGLLDFDFIAESLLPDQNSAGEGLAEGFAVGEMNYEAVLVPALRTIRASTLERLEGFAAQGGRVIWLGEIPDLVDASASDRAQKLAQSCERLPFERAAILASLQKLRDLEIITQTDAATLLYQLRQDGARRHLFLCNAHRTQAQNGARIRLQGEWNPQLLDTFTGEKAPFPARLQNGDTLIEHDFAAHGHLLLELQAGVPAANFQPEKADWQEAGHLSGPNPVTLSEPNVLLLDRARFRCDDGSWQAPEELLRIENLARARFDLPAKDAHICQPWADTQPAPVVGTLALRFDIECEWEVKAPRLALENAANTQISLDGARVENTIEGFWVDEAIQTVALPDLGVGTHQLELQMPFNRQSNVEWCYLLGDFGVRVTGQSAAITAPVRELNWGDWTTQGLPFYAGNVTYRCQIEGDEGEWELHAPEFGAPLLSLEIDQTPAGKIAFAPFRAELGALPTGPHELKITAFGNRANAFGPLHYCGPLQWLGPPAWRSTGAEWSDNYVLRAMGVLEAPVLKRK